MNQKKNSVGAPSPNIVVIDESPDPTQSGIASLSSNTEALVVRPTSNSLNNASFDWDALYDDNNSDQNIGSEEPKKSVISFLWSQLRVGMDLTSITLPTYILERRSLLEMYADFFAHPDMFVGITDRRPNFK
ncbi:Oxysterol-binding protein-related protein 9 [Folsomia candida]|uniref:Oxysterol-binding protein-related protein 9 n=1 Tax=Folsomia candida TaxID=158441 RepID=A0A226F188_FOLCA|nr:Oxysterol-binding protein-related protein 9 [Folsomia candida]